MDGSLSPFLERPSRLDVTSAVSKEKFSRLEYELSSLRTEKKLLQQSKDSTIARYEELLSRKNAELSQLQTNFDFVYNQRKELQLKIKNQQEVSGKSSEDLSLKVKQLSAEKKTLNVKLEKYERQYQAMSGKCEHLRADLNRELSMSDQYREQSAALEAENGKLTRINDSLLERMNGLSAKLESGEAEKKVQELQLSLLSLKKRANDLQARCDSFLQQKFSNELLKQKIASLSSKLKAAETAQSQLADLKASNAELKAKFDDYFTVISSQIASSGASKEDDVLNFVQSYKSLQNKNLIITERLHERELHLSEQTQQLHEANARLEQELQPLLTNLREEVSSKTQEISKLLKQQTLNVKEIEFLRRSLKDLDKVASTQKATMSPSDDPEKRGAMEQYMSNLEKLVDEYKQELDQLRQASVLSIPSLPSKRPRLINDMGEKEKTKNSASLSSENLDLLAQVKTLEDKIQALQHQLGLAQNSSNRSANNPLQLIANPFAKDQLIKQETLSLLRAENEDLINKFVKSQDVESVPKAVFARQENDKDIMQNKIDLLAKKINRLKSVYADKSKEIIAMMSRYFGYTIEFIPSTLNPNDVCSRIKLVSKYMTQMDSENPPFLLIDVRLKALKAHGSYEFKSICEGLVQQWVGEKNQIPCFLSALNLKIYDQYVRNS